MSELETIHKPLIQWLKAEGIEFIRARSDRRSTIEKGWPDFTIFLNNKTLFLEAKSKYKKPDPDQEKVISRLKSKGHSVFVVKSVETAVELVQAWRGGNGASPAANAATGHPARKDDPSGEFVAELMGHWSVFRSGPGYDGRLGVLRVRAATDRDRRELPCRKLSEL